MPSRHDRPAGASHARSTNQPLNGRLVHRQQRIVGESRPAHTPIVGIAYRCDPNLRCTFIVWDGDVTPEQWNDQVDRIVADSAFPPGPVLLADLSTAGGAPSIGSDAIDKMARRWRTHAADLGKMRWAVIPNGAWDRSRRFELELRAPNIRSMVFNEAWGACAWLGLETDAARTILRNLREHLRGTAA